jgi:hypothetical protein
MVRPEIPRTWPTTRKGIDWETASSWAARRDMGEKAKGKGQKAKVRSGG